MNVRRTSLLCALALVAVVAPGARAARAPGRVDLSAAKAMLRAAGVTAPSLTPDQQKKYKDCSSVDYTDSPDGTALDVASYTTAYDCIDPDGWLFAIDTVDAWDRTDLDFVDIYVDTDLNALTGCDGFDYFVYGYWEADVDDLLGGVFRSTSCADADVELVASAAILHPDPRSLGLLFDNYAIGSPGEFAWYGDISAVSEQDLEEFPKTGSHLETGFLDTCTPQSQPSGYVTQSPKSTLIAPALTAAGATDVATHAYGLVTFAGAASLADVVTAIDPQAVVEPNHLRPWSAVPNDTAYALQWNLAAVKAEQAWDLTHGSLAVTVAVVDSGIDSAHPQLAGKLVAGYDATAGTGLAPGNTDEAGHGTAVAGVVAARTNDAEGLAGLGWDTRVMPVKAGDADGASNAATIEGIRWAADHGAQVINLSLGSCVASQLEQDAVDYADSKGVVVVAAAGNSGPGASPDYPAAYPSVLAVGATGVDGTIARYSNTGAYVDLVAPGGSGDGIDEHSIRVLRPNGGETVIDGTSFSSPHVAAAAALLYARKATITPAEARSILTSTAADRGAVGRDDVYGAGLLDVGRAVAATGSSGPAPTLSAPATATAGVLITVGGTAAPGAAVELWGVTAPNGTITRVNTPTVTADANGTWTKTIRPLRNVNLQARVGSAVSGTRFIAVKTDVTQSVAPLAGCVVQVSGRVFEPKPGRTVFIRAVDAAGRTVSLGTGTVQGDGRFLLRKTYACGQRLSVYTVIEGDAVNRPGATGTQPITTRR